MPAYNFQRRFVSKVLTGEKDHTIRRRRKRPTVIGDTLYLYTDQRTKQVQKLREEKCINVLPMEIHEGRVKVGPDYIPQEEMEAFAVSDGFDDAADFWEFWRRVHGLTATNPLKDFEFIQWEVTPDGLQNSSTNRST